MLTSFQRIKLPFESQYPFFQSFGPASFSEKIFLNFFKIPLAFWSEVWYHSFRCGSVGIGRRARLRILCPLGRVSSSLIFRIRLQNIVSFAEVAELADAHGSGPCGSNTLWVRLPSSAGCKQAFEPAFFTHFLPGFYLNFTFIYYTVTT